MPRAQLPDLRLNHRQNRQSGNPAIRQSGNPASTPFAPVAWPQSLNPRLKQCFRASYRATPGITAWQDLMRPPICFLVLGTAMNVYPAIRVYCGQARFDRDSRMIGISRAVCGISFALGQAVPVGPLIRRFGEHRAALYGMRVDFSTLAALGLVTSGAIALMITPLTALGGVVTPALQSILSRSAPANAQGALQGVLQGVLSSLNALAMITSPLIMTAAFSAFTGPAAPVFSPGAPFLLASVLMLICVILHVGDPREARKN